MSGFHHAFAERKGLLNNFFKWWDTEAASKEERTFEDIPGVLKHATAQGWELADRVSSDGGVIHYLFFKKPLP